MKIISFLLVTDPIFADSFKRKISFISFIQSRLFDICAKIKIVLILGRGEGVEGRHQKRPVDG